MQPTVTQKDPAAADWDFNQHLPESDMRWKGEVKVKCCVVGDRDDETPLSCGEEVSDGGNSWKNPTPGGGRQPDHTAQIRQGSEAVIRGHAFTRLTPLYFHKLKKRRGGEIIASPEFLQLKLK